MKAIGLGLAIVLALSAKNAFAGRVYFDSIHCKGSNGIKLDPAGEPNYPTDERSIQYLPVTVKWGFGNRDASADVFYIGAPSKAVHNSEYRNGNAMIELVMRHPLVGDVEEYEIYLSFDPNNIEVQNATGFLNESEGLYKIADLNCAVRLSTH